jgi:hypothetical protein
MTPECSKAAQKAAHEKKIFLEFLEKSGLPIDSESVESRNPPEPDILCKHKEQGFIAFELVELCDSEIPHTTAKMVGFGGVAFMYNEDPSSKVISSKVGKKYKTTHPIELLCYTDGRLVTEDDVIIPVIQYAIDEHGYGMFRRVWLLGEEVCHGFGAALDQDTFIFLK